MESDRNPRLWRIDKSWRFHRSVVLASALHDDTGVWASIRSGARVESHDRSMISFPHDAVVHFPTDKWWTAIFMPGASPDLHVDISTPSRLDGEQIQTIDLDLDVVTCNGEISILDRDEFAAHRVEHHYVDETVAAAQDAVVDVMQLIRSRKFPFDRSGQRMWDVLISSTPGTP